MPLFNSQQQHDRGIRWLGTGATVVIELLVLLALVTRNGHRTLLKPNL
jgi:hypothetical protein